MAEMVLGVKETVADNAEIGDELESLKAVQQAANTTAAVGQAIAKALEDVGEYEKRLAYDFFNR
ncbi:hypothetical protein [Numidum massiliense]|uniref:hypothetical protein n=1 Tax=Numidum massiliense TaxID=1522315 RepID=UPI0006D598DA|nr:hypothetical protein [Numidum massiliense]